jgi:hypothetical protein
MDTVVRIVIGAGLFVFGYLLGREVGRTESIREGLKKAQEPGAHA